MFAQIPFKFFKKVLGHSHVALNSLDAAAHSDLEKIFSSLVNRVCFDVVDRPLRLLDFTSFSMPDTPELQEAYAQIRSQKKGCGFPLVKVWAVFNAARRE